MYRSVQCRETSLRSRGTRERILILFRPKKPRFLDCKLAAPLSFCRGFGPCFCVHWAQNEARSCFGVSCWGFLGTGDHSDGNRQKEMQSQCRLDWALLTSGEKELSHRKARAYKAICVFDRSRYDCSFLVVWFWTVRGVFGQDAWWSAFVT